MLLTWVARFTDRAAKTACKKTYPQLASERSQGKSYICRSNKVAAAIWTVLSAHTNRCWQ